jgi:ABC transport system ATP-binding/permease protein
MVGANPPNPTSQRPRALPRAQDAITLMSLVSLRRIRIGFGTPNLIEEGELELDRGERVCLVGRNGEGKSTLLRILEGVVTPDDGEVRRRDGLRWASLPQALPAQPTGTVFDVVASGLGDLGDLVMAYENAVANNDETARAAYEDQINASEGWDADRCIRQAIEDVGLDPSVATNTLSGGQIRRALLARALVSQPDLLILDEPTNHLDVPSIEWLESLLMGFNGSVIFTTHDRAFLRNLATRIVELDRGELTTWPGDYGNYLRRREERLSTQVRDTAKAKRKLADEERWIRKGIQARRTRNEGRVRALKVLREENRVRRTAARKAEFELAAGAKSSRRVIELEDVSKTFDGHPIVKGLSTIIQRGDKVGIVGPNGAGKTTLVRMMLGTLEPDTGTVTQGERMDVAYFDQRRETLRDDMRVIDWVADGSDTVEVGGSSKHIISYLNDFLFTPERARGPISVLSGGERNRLVLARLFAQPTNVLVLDEPTNDLDVETLELLEELLGEYTGTVLLASHDRSFLDNVVTSTLVFEGAGKVVEYAGGYSDWAATRTKGASQNEARPGNSKNRSKKNKSANSASRMTFKQKHELSELPAMIETLEKTVEALRGELSDPALYKANPEGVTERVEVLRQREAELEKLYERWTELESMAEKPSS